MADEQIQDEQPQDVQTEVTDREEVTVVAVSGPAPIDSIHAAASAIAALDKRLADMESAVFSGRVTPSLAIYPGTPTTKEGGDAQA